MKAPKASVQSPPPWRELVPVLGAEGLGFVLGQHHPGELRPPVPDGRFQAGPEGPHLGKPQAEKQ